MNYLQSWLAGRNADSITTSILKSAETNLKTVDTLGNEYIKLRTFYGIKNHWPLDESGVDIDRYDSDPNTRFFLALKKREHQNLIAGLRLTRVEVLENSLSFEMWTHAVDKPHFVSQLLANKHSIILLKNLAHNKRLWDMTRLVTRMSLEEKRTKQTKATTYVALLLLLGMSVRYTGKDSFWLFTTNDDIKRFLDKLGIQYELIGSGKISYSDVGESYFAWVDVGRAFEVLKHGNPIVADLIQRGYDKEPSGKVA